MASGSSTGPANIPPRINCASNGYSALSGTQAQGCSTSESADSGFAERWHGEVAEIVGITIATTEQQHAVDLGLPNYSCHLINKYDPALPQLPNQFDFIIDNNPSFAACCKFHFFTMWCSYSALLKAGGMALTDIGGMRWVIPGGDLRWSLDDRDLGWIGDRFGFAVTSAGDEDSVRLLTRTS